MQDVPEPKFGAAEISKLPDRGGDKGGGAIKVDASGGMKV